MCVSKTSRWILRQMDLLRNLDEVHYGCSTDMLMHMDSVNSCCYCLLWMPQQMDMLLHMDIVNIIVIVIIILVIFVILVILVVMV